MNEPMVITVAIWAGILFCISQSAMFSGLNLAFFGISRLKLEIAASRGSQEASRVLELRNDSNMLLTTILWGNVGINVLLTLLSNSVLAGVFAFLFSTVLITFIGEILPQAYFSRNALRMASTLAPVLKLYQIILYPVAKPVAKILDLWLGPEGVRYFSEVDFRELIKKHMRAPDQEIGYLEGRGALNFLALDDLAVSDEGEIVDPQSIITLDTSGNLPVFPPMERQAQDPFLKKIHASWKKWIIIKDPAGEPRFVLDSDSFIRETLMDANALNPYRHCHRPIVVKDTSLLIGTVVRRFKVDPQDFDDDVIDNDIILIWGDEKRVITGADILGRLLRGIAER